MSEGGYLSGQSFINALKNGEVCDSFLLSENALNELYVLLMQDMEALTALRENEMRLLMLARDAEQVKELIGLIEPWQTG
jgi:hypothetical protein